MSQTGPNQQISVFSKINNKTETKKNALLKSIYFHLKTTTTEAVAQKCSLKKLFLEILRNSQENTCARVCNFIKKETLTQPMNFTNFLRTPFLI